jgi:hypothetical protein
MPSVSDRPVPALRDCRLSRSQKNGNCSLTAADFFMGKPPPAYSARSGIEVQPAKQMALNTVHGSRLIYGLVGSQQFAVHRPFSKLGAGLGSHITWMSSTCARHTCVPVVSVEYRMTIL